jgi:D-tyrosyl-tRNA(Tyr) deacylase
MRAVVQRVTEARVIVGDRCEGEIGAGLLVLLGIHKDDTFEQAKRLAAKLVALRVFEDPGGKMNLDVLSVSGAMLCVSQFTLYGDVRRGNRPSFESSASADAARPLYEVFVTEVRRAGVACETGVFGAEMRVELVNDGPLTLVLDTDELDRPRRA